MVVVVRARQRGPDFGGAERRDVDDLEACRRVAQQPVRARHVPAGEDEAIPARRQRADQVAQHRAQAGEALERAQLEELVEQERGRRRAGRARGVEEGERRVERLAGAGLRRLLRVGLGRERRRVPQRLQKTFGRRRDRFDVHVLRLAAADEVAQPQQQRGAAAAAAAEHDGDARTGSAGSIECREHAPLERGPFGDHHRPFPSIGMSIPLSTAVAMASG
jgi:hypothetical protein